jgi:hypothetical protein
MNGTIISVGVNGSMLTTPLKRAPQLNDLKPAIGGGPLEAVPGFNSWLTNNGRVVRCVVFCDEEGKQHGQQVNAQATMWWEQALQRQGNSLFGPGRGDPVDVLVGKIAIVFGDDEFMEEL